MLGVINLRGSVVPVVDLRLKFGLAATATTRDTCIIVLEITADGEATIVGAVADSVQEVLELDAERIEPPPRIGTRLKTEFIRGMGNHDDRFLIILDIDRVFSVDELSLVQGVGEEAAAVPA
jgi:purine-binding chemotaxis protein CheW